MKKSFKKGFVLAEVIVISVVVIAALVILYSQFISVNNSYYRSFRYNTIDDLYAVNNIKSFIENDSLDKMIGQLGENDYLDLSSCSSNYFVEYNYCNQLLNTLNIKTLIFTYEDVTELKNNLKSTNFSEELKTFIKTISADKNNKYRLIAEFEDNRFATLKIGSFIVSNISDDCVLEGNTCTMDEIKSQVSLNIAVNDNESYTFNVLKDDGEKLTLIMNDSFTDDIYWGSSISSGPTTILEYIDAKTKSWANVLDITYTLSGTDASNYTGCDVYNVCTSNVYELETINSKARLPRIQELADLGCTNTAGSCPSWLGNSFWTSTSGSNIWIVSSDNRLKTTNFNSSNIKIKPVIMIDKSAI